MSRYAIAVDLDCCIGCEGCMIACKTENNVALGERWNTVLKIGPMGTYPNLQQYFLPLMCQQCSNAPCVDVCPTGASYRDPETDVVLVDGETCIGCLSCMEACPYGVRNWNEAAGIVDKCTLCHDKIGTGEEPLCVSTCCASARYWGDLDDPDSSISQALAAKPDAVHHLPDAGNDPRTFYLLSQKYATWQEGMPEPTYARYVQ